MIPVQIRLPRMPDSWVRWLGTKVATHWLDVETATQEVGGERRRRATPWRGEEWTGDAVDEREGSGERKGVFRNGVEGRC